MKTIFLFLFTFVLVCLQAQERTFFDSEKGYKYGVQEKINDTTFKTLLPAKYKKKIIENGYLLYSKLNKKTAEYSNCYFLDNDLKELRHFKKASVLNDYFIVDKDGYALYDPSSNTFKIEKATKIEMVSGYNNIIYTYKDEKTTVLNSDLVAIIALDGTRSVAGYLEEEWVKRNFRNDFILVGKKNINVYSSSGQLILENVAEIENKNGIIKGSGSYSNQSGSHSYWEFKTANEEYYLLKGDSIMFSGLKGKGFRYVINPNRIVFEQESGFVIYDSRQNLWTEQVFQEILSQHVSSNRDKQIFVVKYNDIWRFVDGNYKPINNETFYNIEAIPGGYKLIKSKETAEQVYLYSYYGTPIIENFVDEVEVIPYSFDEIFVATKNGKKSLFVNEKQLTPFIYNDITQINEESRFYKGVRGDEVVLIDSYIGSEFFKGEGLTDVQGFQEDFLFYEYPNELFAYKGNNFSLVDFDWVDDTTLVPGLWGDFEFDAYDFNEEYFEGLLYLKRLGKWGCVSLNRNEDPVIMPFEYDNIEINSEASWELIDYSGAIVVENNNLKGLYLLYAAENKVLIEPKFDDLELFDGEFIITKKNKLYGLYGYDYEELCPPILLEKPSESFIYRDADEITACILNGESAKCVFTYDGLKFYDDLVSPALGDYDLKFYYEGELMGLLSYDLDTIIQAEYSSIERHPNEDWYITTKNGKVGVVDSYGAVIIPNEHDEIKHDKNGVYDFVKKGNKWAVYSEGIKLLPLEFQEVNTDSDFVYAKKGGLWGAYDYNGEIIIEHRYKNYKYVVEAAYDNF